MITSVVIICPTMRRKGSVLMNLSGSVAFRVESLLPEPDVGGTLPGWKLSSHKHWV